MKKIASLLLFLTFLVLLMSGFGSSPSSTATPVQQELGETIIVNSTADSGPGTLRQALLYAQSGDTITFNPTIFPPGAPATIYLEEPIPIINQDNLTIDASNTGVILDGSNIAEGVPILEIHSDGNTVRGLQIINFCLDGAGIVVSGHAKYNTIGGDRNIGSGPLGQGNLIGNGGLGIGIWDGASFNTITGNLIGTDVTGEEDWGNENSGIGISHNSNNNIIGPNNTIAYNGIRGIDIFIDSVGNTIVQNSIHDNWGIGIRLSYGGNTELAFPFIFDFDLGAGTVKGVACPNCTVEFFSDSHDEGEIYEGQTTADDTGVFAFNKGTSFAGPFLTATATDPNGNTSTFSIPVSGPSETMVVQEGNNSPKTEIQTKRSKELMDNHIADLYSNFWPPCDFERAIDAEILSIGSKRIRLAVNGICLGTVSWDKSEFSIDPYHDELITRLADNDITIEYVLTFWDIAHGGQEKERYHRFQTEEEFERYENFVRFIVHHFKDRIEYYEIWNEPEIDLDVETYLELVRRAIPVIREEYPEAKIKVGSVMPPCTAELEESVEPGGPCEPGSRDYLLTVLRSDVMPLVDVIGWHPMFGTSPAYDCLRDYYYAYPSLVQEIKDEASAHGFKGEYAGNELTWSTLEYFCEEPWRYSETVSAKYYARGIVMHRGMGLDVGVGGTNCERNASSITIRNLCTIMAGAEPTSLPAEIESEATNIRNYNFSLPNGDKLIALWTDGVAVDADPGVKATLTFPGITTDKVMGIDILNSFEQEMITDVEDGNLVVRDLLIKDYPIILRFTNTTP